MYKLGVTAYLVTDGEQTGDDLMDNNGPMPTLNVPDYNGKTVRFSLDYEGFPAECKYQQGSLKKVIIRDHNDRFKIRNEPTYTMNKDCVHVADLTCTNNDCTGTLNQVTVTWNHCYVVTDDEMNDVNRCNDPASYSCVVDTDTNFDNEPVNSQLNDILDTKIPEPSSWQYFDLSMEQVAEIGNYDTDGVTFTIYSIGLDQDGEVWSHSAQFKITIDERPLNPIQIDDPMRKLLMNFDLGELRVPAAS